MTEAHRRHLSASVRYIGQLLDEADRVLPQLPDAHRRRIAEAVNLVRREIRQFGQQFDLDLRAPRVDPLHAVHVQLSVASISVSEMRSRPLRGYGELDARTAADLDSACNALESAIQRAQYAVDGA